MPRLAGAGTGIIRAMEEKPEVTFENLDSAHEYVTIIKRKPSAGNQESNGEGNGERNWVKPVRASLTGSQKDIVNFCSVPRTTQEIQDRIVVSNRA